MINWEELKHIHVIRKLEAILSQWFDAEVFFLDQQGRVQNYDHANPDKTLKNPLCKAFYSKEGTRETLLQAMVRANEKLFKSEDGNMIVDGPAGLEKAFVTSINVDGEFVGSVYAYAFLDSNFSDEAKKRAEGAMASLGLEAQEFGQAVSKLKKMSENEKKYFFELVDLVAQEIVTFHTEIAKREERISALNDELGTRYKYDSMMGKSKPMQELYSMLDKIRSSDATVLIQGENGTGKELIAKAIHYNSNRKDRPFITVNCSAFNENLLDSELFGHVKGSFTGAVKDKKGLFEAANHGTLFLDEIGDMSLAMQVKLLRVLQEGTLTPVGGTEQKKVEVRVVAATNKDLKAMVEDGSFREDLYYRINVINLVVPPLRDRKEDINLLLEHFMERECKEKNLPTKTFGKRTMEKVLDYPWPGNVRELENEVERLVVLSGEESKISLDMLSERIRSFGGGSKVQGVRISGKLKDALEELEKTMILEGLRRTKWNKSRLAKELGISRAGLIMKVEKYHLDKRKIAAAKKESA